MPDPGRAERIKAMRAKDAQLHEVLDQVRRTTQELRDRLHYEKSSKELNETCQETLRLLPDLVNQRIAVIESCFLANYALQRECETLQDELDRLEDRPPCPDPLDALGPEMLAQLSADQVTGLRFVSALGREPAPPAPESTDAYEKAQAYVEDFETKLRDLEKCDALFEVAEVRIRRGWAPADDVATRRVEFRKYTQQMEAGLQQLRDFLRSSLERHGDLHAKRRTVREALQRRRADHRQ